MWRPSLSGVRISLRDPSTKHSDSSHTKLPPHKVRSRSDPGKSNLSVSFLVLFRRGSMLSLEYIQSCHANRRTSLSKGPLTSVPCICKAGSCTRPRRSSASSFKVCLLSVESVFACSMPLLILQTIHCGTTSLADQTSSILKSCLSSR